MTHNLHVDRSSLEEKKLTEEEIEQTEQKTENNAVLIGRKPLMNYVVACLTFFNAGEEEISVKARGRAISRAVDTVELLRRAFAKDVTVKKINIGTEELSLPEGTRTNISTIEITLTR